MQFDIYWWSMIRSFLYLLFTLLPTFVGCGDVDSRNTASVQGHVTIDGELASRGTVNFYPKSGGPVATGRIHEDGSYSLRFGQGEPGEPDAGKIATGTYTATVIVRAAPDPAVTISEGGPPAAGARLTAAKYVNVETSGLVFKIKNGPNLIPLNLEGASADIVEEVLEEAEDEGENLDEDDAEPINVDESVPEPQDEGTPE